MSENMEILKLNLRGTKFETHSSTLKKDPKSILSQLSDHRCPVPFKPIQTQDGYFFIDRNPDYFKKILDYLCKEKLDEFFSKRELINLKDEAEFFKLEKLSDDICERLAKMRLEGNRKEGHVVEINVGGTNFHISEQSIDKHPDSLLAKCLKGQEECMYDAQNNIYLDRDPKVYHLIFYWLRYGYLLIVHPELRQTKNVSSFNEKSCLIWSLKNEAEFLKLESLELLLKSYEKLIYSTTPHIILKDMNILEFRNKSRSFGMNKSLWERLMNCPKFFKVDLHNVFIDISVEEAYLIIRNSSKDVTTSRQTNSITDLARKLGIIALDEAIL